MEAALSACIMNDIVLKYTVLLSDDKSTIWDNPNVKNEKLSTIYALNTNVPTDCAYGTFGVS